MARTIQQIYDEIAAEVNGFPTLSSLQPNPDSFQTFLSNLTSTSSVAIWRLWAYLMAFEIWVHETLWDIYRDEIEARAAELLPGTERWYYDQVLIFQLGDGLSYIDGKYQYFPVDESHRIIKRAAVVEVGDQVQIKVAKETAGLPVPLDAAEKSSFEEYIDQIKFAGTNTIVISEDADMLHVNYTIYYDPLLLNPDGSLISDPVTFPVEDAINNYITNLAFNGVFFIAKMEDAIQAATGVSDFLKISVEAKYGALPYSAVASSYSANAGYMQIDPALPLSSELTYLPI